MASVLVVAPMVTGFPQVSSPPQAHPVKSHVRRVGFVKSSVAALRIAGNATRSALNPDTPRAPDPITTARAAAVTPVQDVAGAVTVVGVTWPKGTVSAHGQFQIRTLSGATWSQWQSLGVIDGGPDSTAAASATTGTDPFVVTGASKYEVRSLTTDASVATAATVQAVDPGTSSADDVGQAPGAASAVTAKPTIYTRAQWGANERVMTWTPSYAKIRVGFVHHTVDTNNYTAAEVPAMIRGIYAYHAQTLGWGDIGYNFLVDRFGRIWEGRSGGMNRPVIGGHTYGFNSVSMGVSAIGNYDIAAAPQAMTDAFKRIFAWKFSLSGIPATGTVLTNGKYLNRISGHRDAYQTACPGRYLYAKIPEIRTGTAAIMATKPITGLPGLFSPGDFTGDGKADLLAVAGNGDLYLYRGNGVGGFTGAGTKIGTAWGGFVKVFSPGDFTGDRKADIVAVAGNGDLYLYRGNGLGGFTGAGTKIGTAWSGFDEVFSPGDFTGDRKADMLAVAGNGDLYLYRGNGVGGFTGGGTKIGTAWGGFVYLFSPGDLNGDGKSDIMAVADNGNLFLYRGNGVGGFTGGGTKIGTAWGGFVKVFSPGDLTGDGKADILAVAGNGDLFLYRGNGLGGFTGSGTKIGTGWGGFV